MVAVGGEGGLVHKRRVAAELLQSLARLQPVNSASENQQHASKQEVTNVTGKGQTVKHLIHDLNGSFSQRGAGI